MKDLISDLMRNSRIATRFMENNGKFIREHELRALWADKRFVDFGSDPCPTIDFS